MPHCNSQETECPVVEAASTTSLPTELLLRVLSFLPPNDLAFSGRLSCRDAARHFPSPSFATVLLSQPMPCAAATPWQQNTQPLLPGLPFRHKLALLCTAAKSGSTVNMAAAWQLLQDHCIFPSIPPDHYVEVYWRHVLTDPGTAAASCGHAHLLPWLLSHGCPFDLGKAACAVARHCGLPSLEATWPLLYDQLQLHEDILDAAAASNTPESVAKMAWLLDTGSCSMRAATAEAAAAAGNLPALRWLHAKGCFWNQLEVLAAALERADLHVVQWLLLDGGGGEAGGGCRVEDAVRLDGARGWERLCVSAAESGRQPVEKLVLLREECPGRQVPWAALSAAAAAGRMETVRFLHEVCGVEFWSLSGNVVASAVSSGHVPMVEWLLQQGCEYDGTAHLHGGLRGRTEMVLWLARERGYPRTGDIADFVSGWRDADRGEQERRLEAVRELEVAGWGLGGVHGYNAALFAARWGDVGLMRYLVQKHGVMLTRNHLSWAAMGGCEELIEWMLGSGACPVDERAGHQAWMEAGAKGDRGTLECLWRLRVSWQVDVVVAAVRRRWRLPVLQWLVERVGAGGGGGGGDGGGGEQGVWLRALEAANEGVCPDPEVVLWLQRMVG